MKTPTLKEMVIIHINYRDIFNAVVSTDELQLWLGLNDTVKLKIILNELISEGLLETTDHRYYCVAGRSVLFAHKLSRKRLAQKCLQKQERIIRFLSWIPLIRFIGVSGSVAAENATIDKKGLLDLDIFIVTTKHSLWLVFFLERIFTNIFLILLGRKYVLCFNYAMDYSFLEIHNKNIYTATELFNLKPLYDRDNTYRSLINKNSWVERYYPSLRYKDMHLDQRSVVSFSAPTWTAKVLNPLNHCAYFLFHMTRVIKKLSVRPLAEIKWKFDPRYRGNIQRICNANGGYESPIMHQLERKLRTNFSNYFHRDLLQFFFPDLEKDNLADVQPDALIQLGFTKYTLS